MKKIFLILILALNIATLTAQTTYPTKIQTSGYEMFRPSSESDGPYVEYTFEVHAKHGWGLNYCDVAVKNVKLFIYRAYRYKGVEYTHAHEAFKKYGKLDASNLNLYSCKYEALLSLGVSHVVENFTLSLDGSVHQVEGKKNSVDFDKDWDRVSTRKSHAGKSLYTGKDYNAEAAINKWLREKEENKKKEEEEDAKAKADADAKKKAEEEAKAKAAAQQSGSVQSQQTPATTTSTSTQQGQQNAQSSSDDWKKAQELQHQRELDKLAEMDKNIARINEQNKIRQQEIDKLAQGFADVYNAIDNAVQERKDRRERYAQRKFAEASTLLTKKQYTAALPVFEELYRDYSSTSIGDDAAYYLGVMYAYGMGVNSDHARAFSYLNEAEKRGYKDAVKERRNLCRPEYLALLPETELQGIYNVQTQHADYWLGRRSSRVAGTTLGTMFGLAATAGGFVCAGQARTWFPEDDATGYRVLVGVGGIAFGALMGVTTIKGIGSGSKDARKYAKNRDDVYRYELNNLKPYNLSPTISAEKFGLPSGWESLSDAERQDLYNTRIAKIDSLKHDRNSFVLKAGLLTVGCGAVTVGGLTLFSGEKKSTGETIAAIGGTVGVLSLFDYNKDISILKGDSQKLQSGLSLSLQPAILPVMPDSHAGINSNNNAYGFALKVNF